MRKFDACIPWNPQPLSGKEDFHPNGRKKEERGWSPRLPPPNPPDKKPEKKEEKYALAKDEDVKKAEPTSIELGAACKSLGYRVAVAV